MTMAVAWANLSTKQALPIRMPLPLQAHTLALGWSSGASTGFRWRRRTLLHASGGPLLIVRTRRHSCFSMLKKGWVV